jgi:AcrR family transcriptional regulator
MDTPMPPVGRRRIPPPLVRAEQRSRLLAAVVETVAELGSQEMTVSDLVRRSGISRKTFYQLFDNKGEAVLAAYRALGERLSARVDEAIGGQQDRPERVSGAISAVTQFFAELDADSRAFLAEAPAYPEVDRVRLAAMHSLAERLASPNASAPDVCAEATVGALYRLLTSLPADAPAEAVHARVTLLVDLALARLEPRLDLGQIRGGQRPRCLAVH